MDWLKQYVNIGNLKWWNLCKIITKVLKNTCIIKNKNEN